MSNFARYARQVILPEVGVNGQQLLRDSSALVVGLGGLGFVQLLRRCCALRFRSSGLRAREFLFRLLNSRFHLRHGLLELLQGYRAQTLLALVERHNRWVRQDLANFGHDRRVDYGWRGRRGRCRPGGRDALNRAAQVRFQRVFPPR